MRHFLPLPSSFYLDEEVAGDEEGIDDDDIDNAAKDIAAAAADDIDYATMLPKVKSIPAKAATKKKSAAAAAMPPPPATAVAAAADAAAADATSFSVDALDPLTSHYYADGFYDHADVYIASTERCRRASTRCKWPRMASRSR
jgi:hypothetical protein